MLSVFYRHDKVQQIEALSVNLPIYFGRDVSPSLIYLHLMGLYNFFIYLKLNFCFILIQACFSVHNFSRHVPEIHHSFFPPIGQSCKSAGGTRNLLWERSWLWTLWFCWLLALYIYLIPPSDPIKSEVTFSIMVIQPSKMVFLYYVVDYDELVTTFCSPGIVVETGLWSQIARLKSF